MSRFRPSIVGTVATVVVAGLCVRLGVWQLHRYETREAEMEARRVLHAAPPVDAVSEAPESLEYRRASLTGIFTAETHAVAGGIAYGKNGYAAIGTLDVEGSSVLVLRGWVPPETWQRHLKPPAGVQTVSGVLRQVPEGPVVEPVDREGSPLWPLESETFLGVFRRGRSIPWSSLRAATPGEVAPVYLIEGELLADAEDRDVKTLPASGYAITKKTHHHLEYAAQWFAFAAIALGIWVWLGIRRARSLSARP